MPGQLASASHSGDNGAVVPGIHATAMFWTASRPIQPPSEPCSSRWHEVCPATDFRGLLCLFPKVPRRSTDYVKDDEVRVVAVFIVVASLLAGCSSGGRNPYPGQPMPQPSDIVSVPWEALLMEPEAASSVIEELGPRAVIPLTRTLYHEDPEVRIAAVDALAEFGSKGRPAVEMALEDEAPEVRCAAIEAFGRMGLCPVDRLRECLRDDEPSVCLAAVTALAQSGPSALPALCEAIRNSDGEVRITAVAALEDLGPAAIPALEGALESDDREVRVLALDVLDRMGSLAHQSIELAMQGRDRELSSRDATILKRIRPRTL